MRLPKALGETWGLSFCAVALVLTSYPVPVDMAAVLVQQGINAEMVTAKAIELTEAGKDDAWIDAVIASAGYQRPELEEAVDPYRGHACGTILEPFFVAVIVHS